MSRSRRPGWLRLSSFLVAGFLATSTGFAAGRQAVEPVEISVRQITQFHIGRDERKFGPLEFVGGLEMTGSSRDFGALSAFRFLTPGSDFIGVTDTGFWYFGSIARMAQGQPFAIFNFTMQQMVDDAGQPIDRKWEVDAEGLNVKDGIATVGFERNHRVAQFKIDPAGMKAPFKLLDFLIPANELRRNRGFETVTRAPADGPLEGALVVVSEKSLDKDGNIYAAIIEGPGKGIFTVRRNGEFDITDGAFLPGGDLLLLERSFSMAGGVKMRLRRIGGTEIAKGNVADGSVLLEADMAYQIDNMEGMDVWRRDDGKLIISLVSDDNHSILQRNLYLEFILNED
ncbi:esterase-like activity of phytase family protein [Mesorhizobium sp. NPDC059025]|uniref:esterase-like activity of phytase family protein n=1 Tax=unclassified Mesorhizobium TaxID=325217 RepID=UPI0036992C69